MTTTRLQLMFVTACSLVAGTGCGSGGDGGLDPTLMEGESSAPGEAGDRSSSSNHDEWGDDDTTGVLDWGDDGSVPECGWPCNPFADDDCAEGEKCTAISCSVYDSMWDYNVCRPVLGDKEVGDLCMELGDENDGEDDCGAGLMCWGAKENDPFGTCVAFCRGSESEPDCSHVEGSTCSVYNDGVLPLCTTDCDPLLSDCAVGMTCLPRASDGGFACVIDASSGRSPYGTACENINTCNPGLICVAAQQVPESDCDGDYGCCSPYCALDAPLNCPGEGQECVAVWSEEATLPGYENVGVCVLPLP